MKESKEKKRKVVSIINLLSKEQVMEITGWGKNTVDYIFSHEEEFPAIKIGKSYQVEESALKDYLSKRRILDRNKK